MSLRPDDVGEGRARVSLRNSSHSLVGEGVVSLDTVLAEDVDRTEVELHDHDGNAVGTLGLVSERLGSLAEIPSLQCLLACCFACFHGQSGRLRWCPLSLAMQPIVMRTWSACC